MHMLKDERLAQHQPPNSAERPLGAATAAKGHKPTGSDRAMRLSGRRQRQAVPGVQRLEQQAPPRAQPARSPADPAGGIVAACVQELQMAGINFKAFDLGGHEIARRVWKDYYAKVSQ